LIALGATLPMLFHVPGARSDPGAGRPVAGVTAASSVTALDTPRPTEWLPSKGRQCFRQKRYRNFCQGPRRAPRPHGTGARLASVLGLGEIKTVSRVLLEPPEPRWVAAAGSPDCVDKLAWPVPGRKLWRGYGRHCKKKGKARRRCRLHKGIDIGAPDGTPFRSVSCGLVIYADNGVRGYGNLMVVVHPDASVAFYAHARALYLFAGQHVKRGQVLGEVGHTGIARGSHLHFEYRTRGYPRDPLPYFEKVPAHGAPAKRVEAPVPAPRKKARPRLTNIPH
jgi:hypothetical protein